MKDAMGKVIYVGKAKDLRKRLSSYFHDTRKPSRTRRLVERIAGIEVILVNHEIESLILENNLIKHHRPRFNVLLKAEDQGYPYIVLTDEPYPRFAPFKKHRVNWALDGLPDDAIVRRFGPYPSWRFRTTLLDYVNETFMLRQCHPMPSRACLLHHVHKCSAPCERLISDAEYAQAVKRAARFLSHPPTSAVREMRSRMLEYAERMEYERANRIKAQLAVLERALSAQIVERDVKHDQDVIYFAAGRATVVHIRAGAVLGITQSDAHDEHQFLLSRYADVCVDELVVSGLPDPAGIADVLSRRHGHKVKVTQPRTGTSKALMALCKKNHDYRIASAS
jgi:excinuclease ABC subunit C